MKFIRYFIGAREMAWWLGAVAAFAEGPFGYQHPHGGSQLPVTPVPGHVIPSDRCGH